MTKGSDTGF